MNNTDIRFQMIEAGVKGYQVAKVMGISAEWFSKLLRDELPAEKKKEISKAIKKAKKVR